VTSARSDTPSGQNGARATLRDVAKLAGVHVTTASRVMDPQRSGTVNPSTADRVLRAAETVGYRKHLVASNLRRGRTGTVGVVVPDLANPYFALVVRGVYERLERAGEMVSVVAETRDDPARFDRILGHLAERRVDGIIVAAARAGDALRLEYFAENSAPVVLAVRSLPDSRVPVVCTGDHDGGVLAASHLVALGHHIVGQIRGPSEIGPFRTRAEGFAEAVSRSGKCVVETREPAIAAVYEEGYRLATELLHSDRRPTALFAGNDTMAIGAIDALRAAALSCPEDVSVIGYNDNAFMDHISPPLTTIRVANYEIGLRAAEILDALTRGEVVPRSSVFDAVLVVRESTRPIQATTPE